MLVFELFVPEFTHYPKGYLKSEHVGRLTH